MPHYSSSPFNSAQRLSLAQRESLTAKLITAPPLLASPSISHALSPHYSPTATQRATLLAVEAIIYTPTVREWIVRGVLTEMRFIGGCPVIMGFLMVSVLTFGSGQCLTNKVFENHIFDVTTFSPFVGCGRGTSTMNLVRTESDWDWGLRGRERLSQCDGYDIDEGVGGVEGLSVEGFW